MGRSKSCGQTQNQEVGKLCLLIEGNTRLHRKGHGWRGKKIWGHLPLGLNKWSSDQKGAQFLGFRCCFNWANSLFLLSKKVEDLNKIQCTLLFYWSTSPCYYLPKFWFIIMEPSFSVLPKKLNRRFKNQIFEICTMFLKVQCFKDS